MTSVRLAALAAACLAGPASAAPAPEPVPVTGEFHRVVLRAPLRLEVTEGEPAVAVTADPEVRRRLRIEARGDDLVVEWERDWLPRLREPVGVVSVRLREFRGLRVEGSGDAEVATDGAPRDVSLAVAGSGEVRFRGATRALAVEISGSGGLRAEADAESVSIEVSGSGDAAWSGRARSATVDVSGSGTARLSGSGESLRVQTSGSGDVDASGFAVKQAWAGAVGSGDVSVRLEGGTLRARVAGSGRVEWSGTGEVAEASVSGGGEVRRREPAPPEG